MKVGVLSVQNMDNVQKYVFKHKSLWNELSVET